VGRDAAGLSDRLDGRADADAEPRTDGGTLPVFAVQSFLGRAASELSAMPHDGFDPDPVFPAPPGAPQRPEEPPRTRYGVQNRAARLKALGNAVQPQVSYVVGLAVRATDAYLCGEHDG
jgi:hypothetical protein